MKVNGFKCDFCGTVKGESNPYWYLGFIGVSSDIFNIFHWPKDDRESAAEGFKHICGQQCAQKFLEQWLSK